jgi:hypothetical protein
MSGLLANLPSRGLLVGPKQSAKGKSPGVLRSIRRTPHAPHYFPTNDTSPPKDQLILTDESNRLLSKFHALIKEKESKSNKRSMESAPGASSVRFMAPHRPRRWFCNTRHALMEEILIFESESCFYRYPLLIYDVQC